MVPLPNSSKWLPFVLATSIAFLDFNAASVHYLQPEQVHLSFGVNVLEIIVTWVTRSPTNSSVVEFGLDAGGDRELTESRVGKMEVYEDFGSERRRIFVHRVVLSGLAPAAYYRYHCGDPLVGWSDIFTFKTSPVSDDFFPKFLIYGDMGNENGRAITSLEEEVQTSAIDAVLHVGDLAYDMADHNGRRADEFMRQIEPIAAYVPYQVCPGNHEYHYNFSNYDARFSMINRQQGQRNNFFHSFNVGPVHFIMISTEFYFYLKYGYEQIQSQYNWLLDDLEEANRPENREKRPWVFLMGHRPMYCTNLEKRDCSTPHSVLRSGLPFTQDFPLEPLLEEYGVDIYWAGHQHSYERLWPLYQGQVSGRSESSYINPSKPIHIVTGSPGNREGLSSFGDDILNISAFRTADSYSYTKLSFINRTHMELKQIAVPKGNVLDSLIIGKTSASAAWQQADLPNAPDGGRRGL